MIKFQIIQNGENAIATLILYKNNKIIKAFKNIDYITLKNYIDILNALNINQI